MTPALTMTIREQKQSPLTLGKEQMATHVPAQTRPLEVAADVCTSECEAFDEWRK
jgi:hypothetical protein